MTTIDISTLTPAQLEELMQQAAARKAEIAKEHRETARKALIQHAKELGYTIDDLFSTAGKKRGGGAKFRNPLNPAETWVGRGKRPDWLKAALEAGKTLDELKI